MNASADAGSPSNRSRRESRFSLLRRSAAAWRRLRLSALPLSVGRREGPCRSPMFVRSLIAPGRNVDSSPVRCPLSRIHRSQAALSVHRRSGETAAAYRNPCVCETRSTRSRLPPARPAAQPPAAPEPRASSYDHRPSLAPAPVAGSARSPHAMTAALTRSTRLTRVDLSPSRLGPSCIGSLMAVHCFTPASTARWADGFSVGVGLGRRPTPQLGRFRCSGFPSRPSPAAPHRAAPPSARDIRTSGLTAGCAEPDPRTVSLAAATALWGSVRWCWTNVVLPTEHRQHAVVRTVATPSRSLTPAPTGCAGGRREPSPP